MKNMIAATLAFGLLAVGTQAQQTPPDNTKVNERDRSKAAATADQAKNSTTDRDTMQKIRKAVMADKSLSTYAHNVKIISQGGKVTLKGPVRSEEEKSNIEKMATDVAGAGNVTNEITIKPEASKKKS
ncbi:MAG: BON domain-containing protein [Candidatus Solibacter sp.]